MSSTESRYGLYSQGCTGWSTLRYEEFQEEDVWGVLRETKEITSADSSVFNQSSAITSRRLSSGARMIPKSSSSSSSVEAKMIQQSAPVNIPDWSKIYGKKSSKNTSWVDDDYDDHGESSDGVINTSWDSEEEEEDDDGSLIPPHEWIAKKNLQEVKYLHFLYMKVLEEHSKEEILRM